MTDMLDHVRRTGWIIAEAGLLLVVLCLLLNIILGTEMSGEFVGAVAKNANLFLQSLPAGTLVGLALVIMAYWLTKSAVTR